MRLDFLVLETARLTSRRSLTYQTSYPLAHGTAIYRCCMQTWTERVALPVSPLLGPVGSKENHHGVTGDVQMPSLPIRLIAWSWLSNADSACTANVSCCSTTVIAADPPFV
ncbi:hypothetical protein DL89DRAFT_87758 [Linderina pennispora]|uniref:Uncharacterized protein n=1 Tax=Linderina pennispora TaxID=61395 RepID=A0A1Y1WHU6_9FUNG|nr:uncharacterized protein DL89DRAFT_87758 [Linderina pennispora]ORX73087.1 hypothetical protein DL89DRAFT_87758 [Linderina pennispora]